MDSFYDGDLKDIWDSDLDTAESLKLSNEADLPNWFLDRDEKHATVILSDKLISDALLNGTFPIKSEHSYSLNSDGDSLTSSPRKLPKMDDLEDECYPAISLKTATNNVRSTIETQCLALDHGVPVIDSTEEDKIVKSINNNVSSAGFKLNCASVRNKENMKTTDVRNIYMESELKDESFGSSSSSCEELRLSPIEKNSQKSTENCSDIEIDTTCVKDEPFSPENSCPASPIVKSFLGTQKYPPTLRLTRMCTIAKSDIIVNRKNESLRLPTATSSMIPPTLIFECSSSSQNSKNLIPLIAHDAEPSSVICDTVFKKFSNNSTYNIPLTPPSSLSSEDSQGDITSERLMSNGICNNPELFNKTTQHLGENCTVATIMDRRSQTILSISSSSSCFSRSVNGSCNRQPINTPLISTQPKGSTGILILTEEEKRTLLAEGYPIPQKLPLTKAEEKSLKKIRRKIKNKISAQESRRKKKEYMDQLERRVESLASENNNYKKRVNTLEDAYSTVLIQLQKLQAIVDKHNLKKT